MRIGDNYDKLPAFEFIYGRTEKPKRNRKRRNKRPGIHADTKWAKLYHRYMRSKEWADFRASVIAKRGRWCELCGSGYRVELHHRTYNRLGHEKERDVQLCCHACHEKIHGRKWK